MTTLEGDRRAVWFSADGSRRDLRMLARYVTLGACAGGLGGLLVGGVGGRLAMLLLRFTTEPSIAGIESDDGFTMGQFTLGSSFSLLMVCTVLGSMGGLVVVLGRPFFPARYVLIGWPLAAAAIVGSIIIKGDGVDFTVLEPKLLAIVMFIAIPALGALLITWLIRTWEPWWWSDWKRTVPAAIPGLPALIFFPFAIGVAIVALAWLVALRLNGVRSLPTFQPVRIAALVVFGLLTGLGLVGLVNDVREIL
ncbi:MAG: hypothetical protein ACSLFM_13045 [Tepidiformaceae bacterium]